MHMHESQREACNVSSLLLPYRSWELNSGHQTWQQVSLPTEPSHQPIIFFLICISPNGPLVILG